MGARAQPDQIKLDSFVWPLIIAAVAAVLRIWHIQNSQISPTFWVPTVDPGWYHEAACRIAAGDWGPFPFFRAPAYPTLLGFVYRLFGENLVAARLLNVVLQALTVLSIYWVGRRYLSTSIGLIAAILFSLNGMAIFYSAEILSISLEMLLAVLCIWSLLYLWQQPGDRAYAICGIVWGMAAITRPNFLLLFPLPLAVLGIQAYAQKQISEDEITARWTPPLFRWIKSSLLWLAFAALLILPVTYANYARGGEFVLIATQGGVNFWIGNNPESGGVSSELPGYGAFWTEADAKGFAEQEVGHAVRPGELSDFYYRKGLSFLIQHPVDALFSMIRKTTAFFNRTELSNNKHIGYFAGLSPWLPFLIYLNLGVLVPLSLLGVWALWSRSEVRLLAAMILLYAATVILFFITSRFRMPVVPWLSLLAAGGTVWLWAAARNRFKGLTKWPPILLFAGILLAWTNPWNMKDASIGSAHYMEGNALMTLGKPDQAAASFRKSLEQDGPVDMSQVNLGVLAYRAGLLDSAKTHYQAALSANPRNYLALNNIAVIYELQGDTVRAISTYMDALKQRPYASDPRYNLAALYQALGVQALKREDLEQAAIYLGESIKYEPSPTAHYYLAVVYGQSGNPSRALTELDHALELNPDYAVARDLRNQMFAQPPTGEAEPPAPADQDQAP
jgi:tetratricopeptide (TPR) repeat protein